MADLALEGADGAGDVAVLVGGEVHDGVEGAALEGARELGGAAVGDDALDAVHEGAEGVAAGAAVDDRDAVAPREEAKDEQRAEEAGAADEQDVHPPLLSQSGGGRVGVVTSPRITADLVRRAFSGEGRGLPAGPIDVSEAREAAVAVPIAIEPEPRVFLVLRAGHLVDHAGEIAFPGGKRDATDASLRETAARELFEEVAVREDDVEWVGELSAIPVITGRFLIHPFVGLLGGGAAPRVASGELEEVLELPLEPYVLGGRRVRAIEMEWRGVKLLAPHFPIGERTLYGATAYITYELLVRLAAAAGRELPELEVGTAAPWGSRYRDA